MSIATGAMSLASTALGIGSAALDSVKSLEQDFLDSKKIQQALSNNVASNSELFRLLKQTTVRLAGDITDLAEVTAKQLDKMTIILETSSRIL